MDVQMAAPLTPREAQKRSMTACSAAQDRRFDWVDAAGPV
jgi:hypothetical protein